MNELGLNERHKTGLAYMKKEGRITNREYQTITSVIARTAARDLDALTELRLIRRIGTTGRNVYYVIGRKQDINTTPD